MEKVPKSGYDLIDWIDGFVRRPELPQTSAGFRLLADPGEQNALAFACGMRALADELVKWKREEIEARMREENPEVTDDEIAVAQTPSEFPDIYTPEGQLHQPVSPRSVAVDIDPGKLGS